MKKFLIIVSILTAFAFTACQKSDSNPVSQFDNNKIVIAPSYVTIVDKSGVVYATQIEDKYIENGKRISDLIYECIQNSRNHGDFVSCMAHLTNRLKKLGLITEKEKGILMNIAARADIP